MSDQPENPDDAEVDLPPNRLDAQLIASPTKY